jgi:hypothetical protein
LSAGTLLQATCTGQDNAYMTLPRLATEGVTTSIDFCYIFDCQGGFLGGAIQPCGDPTTTADDIFVDCPGFTNTDTDTE